LLAAGRSGRLHAGNFSALNAGFAMGTTPALHNGLDVALEKLEKLGLTRPPNVLLAEYLAALTAAELLDSQPAAKVSDAFNRLRYSVVPEEDPEFREAVIALDAVAERVRAMSPEDRDRVCQIVLSRLPLPGAERVPHSRDASPEGTVAAPSSGGPAATEGSNESNIDGLFAASGSRTRAVTTMPRNGLRPRLPRVPLEVCAIIALVVFFGGYFSRDAADKVLKSVSSDSPNPGLIRDVWVTPETWVETVRLRGIDEMHNHNLRTSRLALELVLACSDADANTLNTLAWIYLFPDEDGVTNPQRSLQLVNRAIEIERSPAYLDTAAEAYFQLGKLPEALRLQREALVRIDNVSGNRLWRDLSERLKKFEDAERRHDAATATKMN
jgi:tetratricopeptide (TPR) repeat protein